MLHLAPEITGGLPFGLFVGTRQFDLIEVYDGIDFNMRQDYAGLLGELVWRRAPDLKSSFNTLGDTLKKEAEAITV